MKHKIKSDCLELLCEGFFCLKWLVCYSLDDFTSISLGFYVFWPACVRACVCVVVFCFTCVSIEKIILLYMQDLTLFGAVFLCLTFVTIFLTKRMTYFLHGVLLKNILERIVHHFYTKKQAHEPMRQRRKWTNVPRYIQFYIIYKIAIKNGWFRRYTI